MNLIMKMITALRGGANELGEVVVDSQALRILDQEIRDASDELKKSKDSLAEIIAREKLAKEKAVMAGAQVKEYEGYALKALDKGNEVLALEVASKISELETQHAQYQKSHSEFQVSADKLRAAIRQSEQNLRHVQQQVDTVRATDSVQKAQAAVAQRHGGSNSKMRTAMDSLERIKEQQALKAAKLSATDEVTSESSLDEKLQEAGIVSRASSAADILNKLKERK